MREVMGRFNLAPCRPTLLSARGVTGWGTAPPPGDKAPHTTSGQEPRWPAGRPPPPPHPPSAPKLCMPESWRPPPAGPAAAARQWRSAAEMISPRGEVGHPQPQRHRLRPQRGVRGTAAAIYLACVWSRRVLLGGALPAASHGGARPAVSSRRSPHRVGWMAGGWPPGLTKAPPLGEGSLPGVCPWRQQTLEAPRQVAAVGTPAAQPYGRTTGARPRLGGDIDRAVRKEAAGQWVTRPHKTTSTMHDASDQPPSTGRRVGARAAPQAFVAGVPIGGVPGVRQAVQVELSTGCQWLSVPPPTPHPLWAPCAARHIPKKEGEGAHPRSAVCEATSRRGLWRH